MVSQIICPKKHCTGCGLCVSVCPNKSIELDENGYPVIDLKSCSRCGICKNKCPAFIPKLPTDCKVYAAWNKDTEVLKKSSSGGVFTAFATKILGDGGVVFGARAKGALNVYHDEATNISDLELLRGSKYLLSDCSKIYPCVKQRLDEGCKVLFVGTPCQIYALNAYLNCNEYENLYSIDLVCHGVSKKEPLIAYIEESGFNVDDTSVNYRDKSTGWTGVSMQLADKKRIYRYIFSESSFGSTYNANLFLRDCCYTCNRKAKNSVADITIGDFWGVENHHSCYNKDGTSIVLIHNKKGKELFESIRDNIVFFESSYENAADQWGLVRAARCKYDLEEVWKYFSRYGLRKTSMKYWDSTFKHKVKATIFKMLRRYENVQKQEH